MAPNLYGATPDLLAGNGYFLEPRDIIDVKSDVSSPL